MKGVYIIQSVTKTERIYIGSASSLNKRKSDHFNNLKNHKHHSITLQRHYDKYGKDDLIFEVIESGEYLDNNHLLSREQGWYIPYAYKNTEIPYFNTCKIAGSTLGYKHSEETKSLYSEQRKGSKNPNYQKPMSDEQKQHLSEVLTGRKLPPDVIEKIRVAGTGRKHSDETKERMSIAQRKRFGTDDKPPKKSYIDENGNQIAWNKGIPCKEETKIKIRDKNKGKKRPPEVGIAISEKLKGRKKTEEHKQNLSKSRKGKKFAKRGPRTEEDKRKISEGVLKSIEEKRSIKK